MDPISQGQFTIEATGSVKIDKGQGPQNHIDITVTNASEAPATVKVTIEARCGATTDALLVESDQKVIATYGPGIKLKLSESDQSVSWMTSSAGEVISAGGQLVLKLSGFESNTPPGDAVISVVV